MQTFEYETRAKTNECGLKDLRQSYEYNVKCSQISRKLHTDKLVRKKKWLRSSQESMLQVDFEPSALLT